MRRTVVLLCCLGFSGAMWAAPLDSESVTEFVQYMSKTHGFDSAELTRLFEQVERSDRIIDLMSRPAEKVKPWWEYRALFISQKRIDDGAEFWRAHRTILNRAQAQYGVPPHIIVAILGVETSYGRVTGGHRVVEALATLAFHYPTGSEKRARFFTAQLEHFLLLSREDELPTLDLIGSYAGAMGMPQFMPENYRKLAVDFDGDGRRDIWSNAADAIGSIANYFKHHGWISGAQVMSPSYIGGAGVDRFLTSGIKPEYSLAEFAEAGIAPMREPDSGDQEAALFRLEAKNGHEHWLGYWNFYVISKYNPRVKYAMAVSQLAESIQDSYYENTQ